MCRSPSQVLEKLAAATGASGAARLVFVEDKFSTLEKVARAPGFEAWELYLGAWLLLALPSSVPLASSRKHGSVKMSWEAARVRRIQRVCTT